MSHPLIETLEAREAALLAAVRMAAGAPPAGRQLVWFQPIVVPVPVAPDEGSLVITWPRSVTIAHVFAHVSGNHTLNDVRLGYYPDTDDGQARATYLSLEQEGSAVTFPLAGHQLVGSVADIRPHQPRLWEGRRWEKADKVTLVAVDRSGAQQGYTLELTIAAWMQVCQ